jgi:membrane carboxypeptidase/penicillin-binding protein PbpC
MIKYNKSRHTFSRSSSISKRDQDLDKHLKQLELNKQKDLKDIKQKGIKEENTQVNLAYYLVDNQTNNVESDNESLNPMPSDMDGEIDNQLYVIKNLLK